MNTRDHLIALVLAALTPLILVWYSRNLDCQETSINKPLPASTNVSPLAKIDPASIPLNERFPWQPTELISVLGTHTLKHSGAYVSVAFETQGRLLASGATDGIKLWNPNSFEQLPSREHCLQPIEALAFTSSGTLLASVLNKDRTHDLRSWEVTDSGLVSSSTVEKRISAFAAAHSVSITAVLSTTGRVILHNSTKPQSTIRTELPWTADPSSRLSISHNGQILAFGQSDGTIAIWDLRDSAAPNYKLLEGHHGVIADLQFASSDNILLSAGIDGEVRLWNLALEGSESVSVVKSPSAKFLSLAVSSDGKICAAGGTDSLLHIWRIAGDKLRPWATLAGHRDWICSIAFSPDDKLVVAAGGRDQAVYLWNVSVDPPKNLRSQLGHTGYIADLDFSLDGHLLASGAADNKVILWDLSHGIPRENYIAGSFKDGIMSVQLSSDGETLCVMDNSDTLSLWKLAESANGIDGSCIGTIQNLFSADLCRNEKRLATVTYEGIIKIFDYSSSELIETAVLENAEFEPSTRIKYSADGQLIAIGKATTVYLWTSSDIFLKGPPKILQGPQGLSCIAFSRNGKYLCACGSERIVVWNLAGSAVTERASINEGAVATDFYDENHLLTSSFDRSFDSQEKFKGTIKIYDLRSGNTVKSWKLPDFARPRAYQDSMHFALGNSNSTVYLMRYKCTE